MGKKKAEHAKRKKKADPAKRKKKADPAVIIVPGVRPPPKEVTEMQKRLIRECGPFLRQALKSSDAKTERPRFLEAFYNLFFLHWPEHPDKNEDVGFFNHRKDLIKKRIQNEFAFAIGGRAIPDQPWAEFIEAKIQDFHKAEKEKAELSRQMELLKQASTKRKFDEMNAETAPSGSRPRPCPRPKPKPCANRRLTLTEIRRPDPEAEEDIEA